MALAEDLRDCLAEILGYPTPDVPDGVVEPIRFFRQWLGTAEFQFTNKDAAVYPTFSDPVRNAMIAEEDAFVNAVLFDGGGTFGELFEADYVGFTVLDRFVVGYGCDYGQQFRNLPYVGVLRPAIYENTPIHGT